MNIKHYILNDDHTVTEVDDVIEWATKFETGNRIVKQEQVGDWFVSTVFLGLDFGWGDVPMIFETMIFDHSQPVTYKLGKKEHTSDKDIYQERYSTYDEAVHSHDTLVQSIRDGKEIPGLYNIPPVDNLLDNA